MNFKRHWISYVFITPWVLYFAIFMLYPFFLSFENSFLDINILNPENTRFVGIGNWINVAVDFRFWQSILNVFFNQIIFISLSFVISLGAALMLNEITFLSTCSDDFVYPVVTSVTVAMLIFDFLAGPTGPIQNA